jgi:Asp/Glu/hydantoin racemase
MMKRRVAIVSPSSLHAAGPVAAAFDRLWPEAEPINVIDESLYADYIATRVIDASIADRLTGLLHYVELTRAEAAVFTGSVFGAIVEKTRESMTIPVLTSYEAMIEAAFKAGPRLAVVTTSPFSMPEITRDIERYAARHGKSYTLQSKVLDDARIAFREKGDIEEHFRLIASAADDFENCDSLMLGQTSMGPATELIAPLAQRPVLTPLHTTVLKMKSLLGV